MYRAAKRIPKSLTVHSRQFMLTGSFISLSHVAVLQESEAATEPSSRTGLFLVSEIKGEIFDGLQQPRCRYLLSCLDRDMKLGITAHNILFNIISPSGIYLRNQFYAYCDNNCKHISLMEQQFVVTHTVHQIVELKHIFCQNVVFTKIASPYIFLKT
jgi:hypothetical protein